MPPRNESETSSVPRPVVPGVSIQNRINALRNARRSAASESASPSPDKNGKREETDVVSNSKDEELLSRYKEQLQRRNTTNGGGNTASPNGLPNQKSNDNGDLDFQAPRPTPAATAIPANPQPQSTPSRNGLPQAGDILRLGTGEIVIFHRDVASRNYQVALVLNPDGTLSPEGVYLSEAHDYEKIGLMPADHLDHLLKTLTWDRDYIVFHLDSINYAHLVIHPMVKTDRPAPPPQPGTRPAEWPAPPQEAPVEPRTPLKQEDPPREAPPRGKLQRGQHFRIAFSKGKEWEAVFWCEDEQGPVVAHKTQGVWSLMHLDLKRFKDSIVLLSTLSEDEQIEIEKALRHSLG